MLALFIPSIFVPFNSAQAQGQPAVRSGQERQLTIFQPSNIAIMPKPAKFEVAQSKGLLTIAFLAGPLLDSSGNVFAPEVDCNNITSSSMMQTPEGLRPVSGYCQAQSSNLQQPESNIQTTLQPAWKSPYLLNGDVCRERGTDI